MDLNGSTSAGQSFNGGICLQDGCTNPHHGVSALCEAHRGGTRKITPQAPRRPASKPSPPIPPAFMEVVGKALEEGVDPANPFDTDVTGREPVYGELQAPLTEVPPTRTLDSITNDIARRDTEGAVNPTLLERSDGEPLIWAAEVNWVFGKPGGGKTWLGIAMVPNIIQKGGRVALLDSEDYAWKTHQRAEAMDELQYFTDKQDVRHIGDVVWESASDFARDELYLWLLSAVDPVYSCVIIDSAERTGAPSDGGSIAEWHAKVVKPFHDRKIGAIVIDHLPKNLPQDETARGPIGSQGKKAAYTGIGVGVTGIPWTLKKNGSVTLYCDKDRNGRWAQDETMAVMRGNWHMVDGRKVLKFTFDVPPNEGKEASSEPEALETYLLQTIADTRNVGIIGTKKLFKMAGVAPRDGNTALQTIKAMRWVTAEQVGRAHHFLVTDLGKAHLMALAKGDSDRPSEDNPGAF